MEMLAAFRKAEYLLRFAVHVTNLTLYQDSLKKKRCQSETRLTLNQSIKITWISLSSTESSKPHPWFGVLKNDEKHLKPKKENAKQVVHTELQRLHSSERLQMYTQ